MKNDLKHDVRAVALKFEIPGEFLGAAPYGGGHINDTYCAVFDRAGTPARYILQRINHDVFKNPVALMQNVWRVTEHLGKKIAKEPEPARRALKLIQTREGNIFHHDAGGNFWRAYFFIEQARSFDVVESPEQAFKAARAFGRFQKLLADLPSPRLHDTIPGFHDTPKRFAALEKSIAADAANRACRAKPEIDFAFKRRALTRQLLEANLPERVTHNDTKLNNVMFDDATGEGICVIDLDTVMPGLALYDFGDLVRTATSPAAEDERDLSKVSLQTAMFEALARGYLEAGSDFLTEAEKKLLVPAGKLITFEIGIRFLADFLAGDPYFKVHRENHNLDRCRTQFKLVEEIERHEEQLNQLVKAIVNQTDAGLAVSASQPREPSLQRNQIVPAPDEVICPAIPPFDPANLDAIRKAFQLAQPIPLEPVTHAPEDGTFMPGFVRTGRAGNALLVFAELDDMDISTRATAPNQRLWELGDVFEIFVRPAGQSAYAEFQIAPNNCRLHLLLPDATAVKKARAANDCAPFMVWSNELSSDTWVRPAEKRWFVFLKLPHNLVCERQEPLQGQRWHFSFSRMDYTTGREKPILSSTSAHKIADFHCQEEWRVMRFL